MLPRQRPEIYRMVTQLFLIYFHLIPLKWTYQFPLVGTMHSDAPNQETSETCTIHLQLETQHEKTKKTLPASLFKAVSTSTNGKILVIDFVVTHLSKSYLLNLFLNLKNTLFCKNRIFHGDTNQTSNIKKISFWHLFSDVTQFYNLYTIL
jgi:hypothetical protein